MVKKMSLRPSIKTIDDFAKEANLTPVEKKLKDSLPWLQPGIREDVIKGINVRLSEVTLLKLNYLSEHLKQGSQQEIARSAIERTIESLLQELFK